MRRVLLSCYGLAETVFDVVVGVVGAAVVVVEFREVKYEGTRKNTDVFLAKIRTDYQDVFQMSDGGRNFQPNRDVRYPFHVYMDTGTRGNGLHARGIYVQWTAEPPAGYKAEGVLFIPILRPTTFRGLYRGDTGTLAGSSFIIVGTRREVEV